MQRPRGRNSEEPPREPAGAEGGGEELALQGRVGPGEGFGLSYNYRPKLSPVRWTLGQRFGKDVKMGRERWLAFA